MKATAETKWPQGQLFCFFIFNYACFVLPAFSRRATAKNWKKKTMFASLGFSCAKAFSSPSCNGSPYFFCGFDAAPRGADRFPDTAVLHLRCIYV